MPDWPTVHQELKRKGVTRQLLWEEYAATWPNRCYSYSQFCARYQAWRNKQRRSMRQLYKAGEKLFCGLCRANRPVIAKWIANQVEEQFGRQGSYLIDFYHLSEYLGEASKSCSAEPKQWLKAQQAALKNNRSAYVLETLLPYMEPPELPDAKAPVRKAYRYLRNRSDQVDYRQAIEKERPIGSGEVESAHRYVVQERLKKVGAWWSPENVDPMLALRITRINGHWEAY